MQEYRNNDPELFITDEEELKKYKERKESQESFNKKLHASLVAQMDARLVEDSGLIMKSRTFFVDSDLAKVALAKAMKKGRK